MVQLRYFLVLGLSDRDRLLWHLAEACRLSCAQGLQLSFQVKVVSLQARDVVLKRGTEHRDLFAGIARPEH